MTAPLGSRACPTLGCTRHITETPGGLVRGRCDDCIRRFLREAFRHDAPQGAPVLSPRGGRSLPAAAAA